MSHPIGWLFYFPNQVDTEQQNNAVIELWKAVIEQGLKDGDYEALAALPVDLFIALGMDDPYVNQEELEGHVFAPGCSRAFNPSAIEEEYNHRN